LPDRHLRTLRCRVRFQVVVDVIRKNIGKGADESISSFFMHRKKLQE